MRTNKFGVKCLTFSSTSWMSKREMNVSDNVQRLGEEAQPTLAIPNMLDGVAIPKLLYNSSDHYFGPLWRRIDCQEAIRAF